MLGGNGVPIDAIAGGEFARRLLGFRVSFAEELAHGIRNIGEARSPCALIQHGFDAEAPRARGDICLIDGAQFLDAAGQQIEIDGADAPAFGEHAVEHRDMRVQLRIRRLQRHFTNVRVSPAFLVVAFDIDRRPGGVVLKADPAERARLDAIRPALSLAGKAELCLGIASSRRPQRADGCQGAPRVRPRSEPGPTRPRATCRPKTSDQQIRRAAAWHGFAGDNPPYQ